MRELQLDQVESGLGHVAGAGDEVVANPHHRLRVERPRRLAERDVRKGRGAEERRLRDGRRGLVAVVRELPTHLRALCVDRVDDATVAGDTAWVARENERSPCLPSIETTDDSVQTRPTPPRARSR